MSSYHETRDLLEQAHLEAQESSYFLLRLSERRWAVVARDGGSSVTEVNGHYVGYKHARFVDGGRSLPFGEARELIGRLRREEVGL